MTCTNTFERLPSRSSLLDLAPGGVCPATSVTRGAVRSYRPISPLPSSFLERRYNFCGTFPKASLCQLTPADVIRHPILCGARTFLQFASCLAKSAAIQPSGALYHRFPLTFCQSNDMVLTCLKLLKRRVSFNYSRMIP